MKFYSNYAAKCDESAMDQYCNNDGIIAYISVEKLAEFACALVKTKTLA